MKNLTKLDVKLRILYVRTSLRSHTWKFYWVYVKRNPQIMIPNIQLILCHFCTQSLENRPDWKSPSIIWKFLTLFLMLEKKKPTREKFSKMSISVCENKKSVREKMPKCGRETMGLPVKSRKIVCLNESDFLCVKKLKKDHKYVLRTVLFSRGKNTVFARRGLFIFF